MPAPGVPLEMIESILDNFVPLEIFRQVPHPLSQPHTTYNTLIAYVIFTVRSRKVANQLQGRLFQQDAEIVDLLAESKALRTSLDALLARQKSAECERCCTCKGSYSVEEPDTEPVGPTGP